MAFDGIVTKAIASELQQLLGARIDKIFQPNSNNIILGFYFNGNNYALNICTNSNNYRISLTTHPKPNPKIAPNFCMVLRKHLLGLHIKNIITNNLERIITIEFEGFDDIDDIVSKKLVIELMGKHCNVILLNEENIIIDSLRHINNENSTHIIIPNIRYKYPNVSKLNFLDCLNFEEFKNKTNNNIDCISDIYNGISKQFINFIKENLLINDLESIYNYLNSIISNTDSLNLKFEIYNNDYFLVPSSYLENLSLNFFIDDFYYKKECAEDLKIYRDTVLKLILSTLSKYKKRLKNIDTKLSECTNMDKYRLYGELITANLYKIKKDNLSEIKLENYYDNNNLIEISLNKRYSPQHNAKNFYKKYNKLKKALEIVTKQKEETLSEIEYIESIVYELDNCSNIEDVQVVYDEISENEIFKNSLNTKNTYKKNYSKKPKKLTSNKFVAYNPLKYVVDKYTIYVGRNNKENDYLTNKFASKNDLWFHTKDIHGSHVILKTLPGETVPENIIYEAAKLASQHSKAKSSSNVPVDYCLVQFVKKIPGNKPGLVIYRNNKTIYV